MKSKYRFYVYGLYIKGERKPFYIGKGTGRRVFEHTCPRNLSKNSHKNQTIKKALREGKEIESQILIEFLSEELAFTFEAEYIEQYGRRDLGTGCLTNQTDGGEGVSGPRGPRSQAHKDAISRALKGKKKSEEHRNKLALATTGFKHSVETRIQMSLARSGVPRPPEVIAKAVRTRIARGNHIPTEQTKQRVSAAVKKARWAYAQVPV